MISKAQEETYAIRQKWRENYDQFAHGSRFRDKEDWQSSFSSGKFEVRVRNTAGEIRDILLNHPDWFDLEPWDASNERVQQLKAPLLKLFRYHLRRGKFARNAGTFVLVSLLAMGRMVVSWRKTLTQNPNYIKEVGADDSKKEDIALAKKVQNPSTTELAPEQIQESLQAAFESFSSILAGEELGEVEFEEQKQKPYLQVGTLAFDVTSPDTQAWEPTVGYIEESPWGSYEREIPTWEIYEWIENKYLDKVSAKELEESPRATPKDVRGQRNMANLQNYRTGTQTTKVTYYAGPLIIDGRVKNPRYACIILNDSILAKEWKEYPYWEPCGHKLTPFVDASVKEVPFRATGAGVGDNAVKLDRMLDSNLNLMNDSMRLNTVGVTVVDEGRLIDPGQLEKGIEPGLVLRARGGDAKKVISHESLTNNLERQWDPVNQHLEQSINELMGASSLDLGGPTQHSRTTAQEVQAQLQGSSKRINHIAIDLETTFLIPVLEKAFARVLQFGLSEVRSNPELEGVLSEEERELLSSMTQSERVGAINYYYSFKVNGFSTEDNVQQQLRLINELFTIANAGGPLGQIMNQEGLLRQWLRINDMEDNVDEIVVPNTEASLILLENQLMQAGRMIAPVQGENSEVHLRSHLSVPNPSPQLQAHIRDTQMMVAQIAQQQQAGQQQQQQIQ